MNNIKELIIPTIGFQNTGSICYFNSLIQCLLSSEHFISYVSSHPIFYDFFKHISEDQWNATFTTSLLQSIGNFQPNQSSSEYFLYLLDYFKWEDLFECKHLIQTKCTECHHLKENTDVSYNPLIEKTFSEFVQFECELENVACDGCKRRTALNKKQTLHKLSNLIVLSLNKYFTKTLIEYPSVIQVGRDVKYRLIGTIEHLGVLGGGHYIARVRRGDEFYIVDDMRVTQISEDTFTKCVAETYMVFYERMIE